MVIVIVLSVIVVGIALIYLSAFKKTFVRGPFPRFGKKELIEEQKNPHWEELRERGKAWREAQEKLEVSVVSFDGLKLVGTLYEREKRAGVFILFHGYRSGAIRDFDCILEKYYNLGYSIITVDQRAHGRSEGKYITYGILERFDVKSWIDFAKERYGKDVPIYLDGLSMGATTVLMASGLDLDANVRGIIADCAFTSPRDIIYKVGHDDMNLPYFLFMPQMKFLSRVIAKFDMDATTTKDSVERSPFPFLFIHGTADELVPYEMAKVHYSAGNSPKELVTVEGATHGFSYIIDTDLVERKLYEFVEKTKI